MFLNPEPRTLNPPLEAAAFAISTICLVVGTLLVNKSSAQPLERPIALSPAEVEQLDPTSLAHLENVKRFLTEAQWAEAVESIRRVQEADPSRLVRVGLSLPLAGFERYITASEYCQWRLAALAHEGPEALTHYRRLVDPLGETWLRQGERDNDEDLLRRVVEQAFASRFGDDALLKLGDLALARGDHASARAAWERISPKLSVPASAAGALRAPVGSPLWLPLRRFDFAVQGPELAALLNSSGALPPGTYPDTDLDLASVQARLVLASILEGSRQRAGVELAILKTLFPQAHGKLAGQEGPYAELLQRLLEESSDWLRQDQQPGWPTFGGDASRGNSAAREIDPAGRPLWSYSLPRLSADREVLGADRLRAGDDRQSLLAYHPIVVAGKVLLRLDARGNSYIVALDLKTGQRLWQVDYSRGLAGGTGAASDDEPWTVSDAHVGLAQQAGIARYTLTSCGNKAFARMGSPITVPSARRAGLWLTKDQGFLLGLDLTTEGKPLEGFPIRPPSGEWSFEGTPLADDGVSYVAMRRTEGARSQPYLAAFEMPTAPAPSIDELDQAAQLQGKLKWRTRICSSATLMGGDRDELTHLLVTLDGGRLYLNTNAGAVAAVNADNGRLLWILKYPRAPLRSASSTWPQRQLSRDLTPCLAWKDLVIAAPSDCDRVFAVEATTGQVAWASPQGATDDMIHLLGVANGVLLASGDYLHWIDALTGKLLTQFPSGSLGGPEQAAPSPRGLGRGLVVGEHVWWPTRENILVFETRPVTTEFGLQPKLVREIPLLPRGATGGNLVIADGILLIATGDKLLAFGE